MEFKTGQKCLYLFDGEWFPCEIVGWLSGDGVYEVWRENGTIKYCSPDYLEPDTRLLDKPRESSEQTPSYMTFERMLSEMKHFPVTFMNAEGCDNGV